MTFENSLERLKQIIKLLESGNVSLSESLDLYKEAVEISVKCKKELEQAKLEIEVIDRN